ncbi:MAG: STAS domain-containing protein [Pseudomonadota bacterium]
MDIETELRGASRLITIQDERIDAAVAIQFKDKMRAISDEGEAHLVVDLTKVSFVDSSGLGAIVASMKQLKPGQKIELAGLTPTVQKVFRLTRMDSVFTIHEDVTSAFAATAN